MVKQFGSFFQEYTTFLSFFDMFPQSIPLHINQKPGYRTSIGGLLTLTALMIALIQSIGLTSSMIDRSQAKITTTTLFNTDPARLSLNSSGFLFAIGTDDPYLQSADSMIFTGELAFVSLQRLSDNSVLRSEQTTPLEPCTREHFGGSFEAEYTKYNLSRFLCPSTQDLNLRGSRMSEVFEYTELRVRRCQNGSAQGLTCAQHDTIERMYEQDIDFRVFYTDHVVDLKNSSAPVTRELLYQYWRASPSFMQKQVEILLAQTTIQTQADWFSSSATPDEEETFTILENWNSQSLQIRDGVYFSLVLRRGQVETTYLRSYLLLTDVLAHLGGLLKVYLSLLGAVALFYNSFAFRRELMNEVYDFHEIDEKDRKQKTELWKKKVAGITTQDEQISLNGVKELKQFTEMLAVKVAPKQLIFSFGEYLASIGSWLCRCRTRVADNLSLFLRGSAQMRKDLDVVQIIQKLQEFDKLKELFFTEDQLKVFCFIPRPLLKCKAGLRRSTGKIKLRNQKRKTAITPVVNYSDFKPFLRLFEAYNRIKLDQSSENKSTNELLVNKLDEETKSTFEQLSRQLFRQSSLNEALREICLLSPNAGSYMLDRGYGRLLTHFPHIKDDAVVTETCDETVNSLPVFLTGRYKVDRPIESVLSEGRELVNVERQAKKTSTWSRQGRLKFQNPSARGERGSSLELSNSQVIESSSRRDRPAEDDHRSIEQLSFDRRSVFSRTSIYLRHRSAGRSKLSQARINFDASLLDLEGGPDNRGIYTSRNFYKRTKTFYS